MLTGRKFKLERAILALGAVEGQRKAACIPQGDIVKVVSGPSGDGNQMVDVLWDGRVWTMFAIDLELRSAEITELRHVNSSRFVV